MYEAKIIKDSICNGHRLTTMQITHPRIIHAEFMTHCMFARNASSSRAIPFEKMVQKVLDDPFIPVWWGKNQKGMQAAEQLSGVEISIAVQNWLKARDYAVGVARMMADSSGLNLHKQIVNRLIEPWGWITVCVTGDAGAWSNYFALRCHPMAQPEIQKQAFMAQKEYFNSEPSKLEPGEWHTPYIDIKLIPDFKGDEKTIIKISIGRCARTSYLTQEGQHDPAADIELFNRLASGTPMHASPFEHICHATGDDSRHGKYIGWKSYRHMMPREYITDFKSNS